MLANIQKKDQHYVARFERQLKHSATEIWSYLTENEKLALWFSELKIEDLRESGLIKFDMQNGTFVDMEITVLQHQSIFEFTWAEDLVRFELYPNSEGCLLVLNETLQTLTPHTPRDLAGWHVCLEVIQHLLEGTTLKSRKDEWNKWYEQYREAISKLG
ncbi:SRPBCC family protein [Paenibacillus odorifer]|uniref:Activator of Hsp90 ATPase 1 family protein n=1 Tax=Paenibacillus odorifer TaxID=189426 RepID=A0ABX3GRM3_9BACL|nr:SRPBCC family protein [Paenibacillus odorifer]OMD34010.1 activator of Hsp90 ATPase 1 family protein [Paenibacillus odorifer]